MSSLPQRVLQESSNTLRSLLGCEVSSGSQPCELSPHLAEHCDRVELYGHSNIAKLDNIEPALASFVPGDELLVGTEPGGKLGLAVPKISALLDQQANQLTIAIASKTLVQRNALSARLVAWVILPVTQKPCGLWLG